MTLTSAPAAGNYSAAVLSRIVTRGLYIGNIAYDAAAGTLIRTDGTSWLDDGFLEGPLFKITGLAGATGLYKINTISGTNPTVTGPLFKLDKITLTGETPLPSMPSPKGTATLTVTQWAAVATFTPENWYKPVAVNLVADTYFTLA